MKCRHCANSSLHIFSDLGFAPPSNAYLNEIQLSQPEVYYPLRTYVCESCFLVQTEDHHNASLLFNSEYAYFSGTSHTWLLHVQKFSSEMINLLKLDSESYVIEIASNDGCLLKNIMAAGIPCLGIEPTASTASFAEQQGIPVIKDFFSNELAHKIRYNKKSADLIIANNVYAHVPDVNDFTKGLKTLLSEHGTVTIEFPHLLNLIKYSQFDTIYHEHYSYFSLMVVKRIFEKHGLKIFNVDKIKTHGGSLRIFATHKENNVHISPNIKKILDEEQKSGITSLDVYQSFQKKVNRIKMESIKFLYSQKLKNKKICGYGAAAKANTFLNFCGIKSDVISEIYDASPSKQGKYMPGSHIPIENPKKINMTNPDIAIIFPWNIKDEIKSEILAINEKVRIYTFIPQIEELI